jgi:hypothetical protein
MEHVDSSRGSCVGTPGEGDGAPSHWHRLHVGLRASLEHGVLGCSYPALGGPGGVGYRQGGGDFSEGGGGACPFLANGIRLSVRM